VGKEREKSRKENRNWPEEENINKKKGGRIGKNKLRDTARKKQGKSEI
jgi:hypothetical protein